MVDIVLAAPIIRRCGRLICVAHIGEHSPEAELWGEKVFVTCAKIPGIKQVVMFVNVFGIPKRGFKHALPAGPPRTGCDPPLGKVKLVVF